MAKDVIIKWTHLKEILLRYGQVFIEKARENLGKNGSYATGTLGDTMRPIVEINGNSFKVMVEIQSYWNYVEFGRRPGKFPPPNRIKEWIQVKPIKPRPGKNGKVPTTDQLTFLISRKIAKEGIDPKPFFLPAQSATYEQFAEAIDYAILEDIENFIVENYNLDLTWLKKAL